jgi:aminotransferase, class II
MKSFDFDKIIPRRGTNSYKWDEPNDADVLPMWVADMDFPTAPCIINALKKRVEHGIFGYTFVPDSYYEALIHWFERRHGWHIQRDEVLYTTGVVPAIACALKALTLPGEKVLVQTPVYNCFFSSIKNCGCEVVENPLRREKDSYVIDFDDFERKCSDEKTTVFLLCNPHNPSGRVWTKAELQRMNDICLRHDVRVIADEIHGELIMPGYRFQPFAAVNEACKANSVVLNSPTKAFNIAGLQIANIICSDARLRRKIDRAININEVCDVNPFGVIALQAAYNEGEAWLDALNIYLHENYFTLKTFIHEQLPALEVCRLEGTYLAWVDIHRTGLTADEACEKLLHEAKLMLNSGTMYGEKQGGHYLRINLACPKATLVEGLHRLKKVLVSETNAPKR